MKKRRFSAELAYILGLVLLGLGTAFIVKTNFGVSMVVAPAYLLHLKISPYLPFFTFGVASYTVQFLLVAALSIALRKKKLSYWFSFGTAVLYGYILDGLTLAVNFFTFETLVARILFFALGLVIAAAGIAFMFKTYMPAEAYDLVVKELVIHLKKSIPRTKMLFDMTCLLVSVILSFAFFGFGVFRGISYGTIACALLNARVIAWFSRIYDHYFDFVPTFKKCQAFLAKY